MAIVTLGAIASGASATTVTWYQGNANGDTWIDSGSETVGANYLYSGGHSGTIESGTFSAPSVSAFPWDTTAGDYCDEHGFSGTAGGDTDSAFATADTNSGLSSETGMPSDLSSGYQIEDNSGGTWASACQADGEDWGFWLNAGDAGSNCATGHCGVEHDISFDDLKNILPWDSSEFGSSPALEVKGTFKLANYSGGPNGWLPICLILQDTSTDQLLQDCFDRQGYVGVDGSTSGGDDSDWSPDPQKWIEVNSMLDNNGTYSSLEPDSETTDTSMTDRIGQTQTYDFEVTASQLQNTIATANASSAMQGCLSLGLPVPVVDELECFSTDVSDYQLRGIGDGAEMFGSASTLGVMTTDPTVQTNY